MQQSGILSQARCKNGIKHVIFCIVKKCTVYPSVYVNGYRCAQAQDHVRYMAPGVFNRRVQEGAKEK